MPSFPLLIIDRKDSWLGSWGKFLRGRVCWFDKAGMLPSLVEALRIYFVLFRLFEIMRPPLFWKQPPVLSSGESSYARYLRLTEAGRSLD